MVALNEAYTRVEFRLEREGFDNVPALIRFYVGNRKPVSQVSVAGTGPRAGGGQGPEGCCSQVVGAIIFQPINRAVPLRCLEEKYGLSNNQRERLMTQERRSQKRLSLNISNGHAHDGGPAAHDGAQGHDSGQAGQLRWVAHDETLEER